MEPQIEQQDIMKMVYETPNMKILEVAVENGFSASLSWTDEPASDDFEIE